MNTRFFHWLLLILIGGGSCRALIKKKYHLENYFSYKTRHDYLEYLIRNTGIPEAHWLYIDSAYYQQYLGEMQSGRHSYLYWKTLKDPVTSVFPVKTDMLNCAGKTEDFIMRFFEKNTDVDDSVISKAERGSPDLRYLCDGNVFEPEKLQKYPAHFLIYGYGFGNYYFPFFKRMFRTCDKKQPIFFICIDPVYQLN